MSQFRIGQLYDPAFKKLSPQEKRDNLDAISYAIEERNYTVNLTEEQIADREKSHTEQSIKIHVEEENKKDFVKRANTRLKELKSVAKNLMDAVRYKSEQRYGELFLVDDHESRMMYFFDEQGVCVDQRPMTEKEYQKKLKIVNQ
jgi:hypothetical protein